MALIRQALREIRLLVARGVVRLVNDAGGLQVVQVELLEGEKRELVRVQNYGATGVPPAKSEVIAVAAGGKRSHLVIVGIDDPASRPQGLAVGEYCIYTKFGDRIHLRDDRVIAIKAGTRVEVDAPQAKFLHDVEIMGTLKVHEATTLLANLTQTGGGITTTGNVAAVAVNAATVAASTDVVAAGKSLASHKHPYGVGGLTGTPT